MSGGNKFWLIPGKVEKAVYMAKLGHTYAEIGEALHIHESNVQAKLDHMGVSAKRTPKPPRVRVRTVPVEKPAPPTMQGVRFEDDPRGDADRFVGQKPKREPNFSVTGNSSQMCAG